MSVEGSELRYNDALSRNKRTCRPCSRTPNKLQETALRPLGVYRIVDRRPDGCVIVEAGGKRYFVDYEGRVFREIHIKELRKHYAHTSRIPQ
jgi:hypothetical protein